MADLMFSINKVEVSDNGSTWTDLGATKGGGRFTQDIETVEIQSDQASDPEAVIPIRAPKTITLNLLDAKPENLALAFGGTVSGTDVNIPSLVSGTTKQLKITTKAINGVYFEILVPKAFITGRSEITLDSRDSTAIPLEIRVLAPQTGSPVTITKKTS